MSASAASGWLRFKLYSRHNHATNCGLHWREHTAEPLMHSQHFCMHNGQWWQ